MKLVFKKALVVVAALGIVASVVIGREKPALEIVEPAARINARIEVADELDVAKLDRAAQPGASADPFAQRSFAPPAPAQRHAASPPPKPAAPPLPFRYVGRLLDGDKLAVFLARGEESLSVAAGDTIGEYRVDRITENEVLFTYLPLKTKQSLPL